MKAEKKERKRRERKEQGNSRVHKPAGFRWISLEEQIFHSLSQKLLQWVIKLTGKTKWAFLSFFLSLSLSHLLNHGQRRLKNKESNVRGIDFQKGAERLGELSSRG